MCESGEGIGDCLILNKPFMKSSLRDSVSK